MQDKTTPDQEKPLLNVTTVHRSPRGRSGKLDSGVSLCEPIPGSGPLVRRRPRPGGIPVAEILYRVNGTGRRHLEDGAA